MRTSFFILSALLVAANTVQAQKDNKETIEGDGKIITKDIPVSSFNALEASGVYELKLVQGTTESVKIEADENLQSYFTVHNKGNKLVIEMKDVKDKNLKIKSRLRVFVTFKNLKEIDLSTVGDVRSDAALNFTDLQIKNSGVGKVDLNLSANHLKLDNSGVGNIKLTGKAETAVVKNNGVGKLDAGTFMVQTMNLDNSGVGNAEVNAEKELKFTDTTMGQVKNKGAAPVRKKNKAVI